MARVNRSVLKALEILEILAAAERGMRLKDLAERAAYPASTTHRLISSLLEGGYVEQDPRTSLYHLGTKILSLQAQAVRGRHIGRLALPHLLGLKKQLNGTINLGVLSGNSIVYLETLVPDSMLSFYVTPGTRAPAYCTAMGKVLVAHMPVEARQTLLPSLELEPHTPHTIASLPDLEAELVQVAERGYAVDDEEYILGVRCIAAPIHDHTGMAVAAISTTALADHLLPERTDQVAALIVQAGQAISRALGFGDASTGAAW